MSKRMTRKQEKAMFANMDGGRSYKQQRTYKNEDAPLTKGELVQIKPELRESLVTMYHDSGGMSGCSPDLVNKPMVFDHYYGSNIVASPEGETTSVHLNQERFERVKDNDE